jgi:hypothetical protein
VISIESILGFTPVAAHDVALAHLRAAGKEGRSAADFASTPGLTQLMRTPRSERLPCLSA